MLNLDILDGELNASSIVLGNEAANNEVCSFPRSTSRCCRFQNSSITIRVEAKRLGRYSYGCGEFVDLHCVVSDDGERLTATHFDNRTAGCDARNRALR